MSTPDQATILIADDSAVMRTLLSQITKRIGTYLPVTADNGRAALSVINSRQIDVILLDINMPEMSGIDVLAHMQEHHINIPVIMISGSEDIEQAVTCLKMGAYEYLVKPVDPNRLRVTLKNALSESKLRREVTILSTAIANSPLSIVITDLEGTIEYINPAFTTITGYRTDEALGRNISILKSGTHDRSLYTKIWTTISKGRNWQGEIRNKKKNGELYWQYTMISPVSLKSSAISHYIAVNQDITEKKNTEKALLASQQRFRELTELLPQPLFETSIDGRITYANAAAFNTFEFTREEFEQGVSYIDLIAPEEHERIARNLKKKLGGAAFTDHEYLARRKDGTTFPVLIYSAPIIQDGQTTGIRGIILDITGRKQIEETLRQNQEKYRNLFQSIPDAVIVIDGASGSLVEWNQEARSFFEASPEELAAMHFTALFPEETAARASALFSELTVGSTTTFESNIVTRYGVRIDVSISVGAFASEGAVRYIGIFRDITEQKKSEELIRENIRLKNDFISNVSHELRTPLFSILGFSSTLLEEQDSLDRETFREFLDIIHSESTRLSSLIEDVLTISRIDSGNVTYKKSSIEPASLLAEVCRNLKLRAEEKHIELRLQIAPGPVTIYADPDAFKQAIINILGNALKFTPEHGKISVSQSVSDKSVVITISDTGLGIPKKDLDHIFEKFYRVERPEHEIEGTGLGLPIVKEIIEEHDGSIAVESRENHGTTFFITLPCERKEENQPS
ncbi:MAG: PAS domain S-box protein [Prosthecochloris sp.]|nr:PAS domain S-box protein [Prosthecochloris sp.]